MSKAVRSVGRAIGKVVKGAVNVVKKVAKSPLAKVALTAAAFYFAVPAVSGLMGGGATGTVMGNLSTAWSGLTGATSSALAGNFGAAGSQLAAGFTGSAGAAAQGIGASYGAAGATPGMLTGSTALTGAAPVSTALPSMAASAAPVAAGTGGLLSNPYVAPALVHAGAGMLSSYSAGKQREEQERKLKLEKEEDRQRYSSNIGTRLWGG